MATRPCTCPRAPSSAAREGRGQAGRRGRLGRRRPDPPPRLARACPARATAAAASHEPRPPAHRREQAAGHRGPREGQAGALPAVRLRRSLAVGSRGGLGRTDWPHARATLRLRRSADHQLTPEGRAWPSPMHQKVVILFQNPRGLDDQAVARLGAGCSTARPRRSSCSPTTCATWTAYGSIVEDLRRQPGAGDRDHRPSAARPSLIEGYVDVDVARRK